MLSVKDIVDIHKEIDNDIQTNININLIGSALSSYHYFDKVEDQIVSIFFGIVKNHPFTDGNKRTSIAVLCYLMEKNGFPLPSENNLFSIAIRTAESTITKEQVKHILFFNTKTEVKDGSSD